MAPRPFGWLQEDEQAAMAVFSPSKQPAHAQSSCQPPHLRNTRRRNTIQESPVGSEGNKMRAGEMIESRGGDNVDDSNHENWVHGQQEYRSGDHGREISARLRALPSTSKLPQQEYNDDDSMHKIKEEEGEDQTLSHDTLRSDSPLVLLSREASALVEERERSATVMSSSPGLGNPKVNRTRSLPYAHKSQPRYVSQAHATRCLASQNLDTTTRNGSNSTFGNETKVKEKPEMTPELSSALNIEAVESDFHTPVQNVPPFQTSRPRAVISPHPYNLPHHRYATRASSRLRSASISEDCSPSPQPLKRESLLPSPIIKFASLQSEPGTCAGSNVLWNDAGGRDASIALPTGTKEPDQNDKTSQAILKMKDTLTRKYNAVSRLLKECEELEQRVEGINENDLFQKLEKMDKEESLDVDLLQESIPDSNPAISPNNEAVGPPAPHASSVSSEEDGGNSETEANDDGDVKVKVEEADSEDDFKEIIRNVISPYKKPILISSASPPEDRYLSPPASPTVPISRASNTGSPFNSTHPGEQTTRRVESQPLEDLPGKKSGNLFKPRSSSSENDSVVKKRLTAYDTEGEIEAMLLHKSDVSSTLQKPDELGRDSESNEAAFELQNEPDNSTQANLGEDETMQDNIAHLPSMQVDTAQEAEQASRIPSNSPSYVGDDDDHMSEFQLRALFTSPPLVAAHTRAGPDYREDSSRFASPDGRDGNLSRSVSPYFVQGHEVQTQRQESMQGEMQRVEQGPQAMSREVSASTSKVPVSPNAKHILDAAIAILDAAIDDRERVPQKDTQAAVNTLMRRSSKRAPPKAVQHESIPAVTQTAIGAAQRRICQPHQSQSMVPSNENTSSQKSQPLEQAAPQKDQLQVVNSQKMINVAPNSSQKASYYTDTSPNEQIYEMTCPRCEYCGSTAIANLGYFGTCDVARPSAGALPAPVQPQSTQQQMAPVPSGHEHARKGFVSSSSDSSSESVSSSDSSLEEAENELMGMEMPNVSLIERLSRPTRPTAVQLREQYTYTEPVQASPRNTAHDSVQNAPPIQRLAKTVRIKSPEKTKKHSPRKKISLEHNKSRYIPETLSNKEKKPTLSEKVEQAIRARPKTAVKTGQTFSELPPARQSTQDLLTSAMYNRTELPTAARAYLAGSAPVRPPGQAQRTAFGSAAKVLPPTYMAAAEGRVRAYTRDQPISGPSRISEAIVKKPTAFFMGQLPQSGALVVRNMPTRQPTPQRESEKAPPKTAVKKSNSRQTKKAASVKPIAERSRLRASRDLLDESDEDKEEDEDSEQQVASPPRVKKKARSIKDEAVKPLPPKKPTSISKKRKLQPDEYDEPEQKPTLLNKRLKVEVGTQAAAPQQAASNIRSTSAKSVNARQLNVAHIPYNKLPTTATARTVSIYERPPNPVRQDETVSNVMDRKANGVRQTTRIAAMPMPVKNAPVAVPQPAVRKLNTKTRPLTRGAAKANDNDDLDEYFRDDEDHEELAAQAVASKPANHRSSRQQNGLRATVTATTTRGTPKTRQPKQTLNSQRNIHRNPKYFVDEDEDDDDDDGQDDEDNPSFESSDSEGERKEPTKSGRSSRAPGARATALTSVKKDAIPGEIVKPRALPKKTGAGTARGRGRGQAAAFIEAREDDQNEADMSEHDVIVPAKGARGKKTPAGLANPPAPRGRGRGRGKGR